MNVENIKKTVIIDGGLGRVVTSIPALEKLVDTYPDTLIITYGWTQIFWGNKKLMYKVYDNSTKGLLEKVIEQGVDVIKPEPYFAIDFINQKINLSQAFDTLLNNIPGNLPELKLYFSKNEKQIVSNRIDKTKKTIVYQPFGSTSRIEDNVLVDNTVRSLSVGNATKLLNFLISNNYQVIMLDTKNVFDNQQVQNANDLDFRMMSALISVSDYFIGCDSSGQHIAKACNIPGTTIFGGTSPFSFGYPDWFNIINKTNDIKTYPFRLCDFDQYLAEIYNDGCIEYNDEEIDQICNNILVDIKNKT